MLTYLGLCLAALAAGAINSIAGGGTLLTFPALQLLAGVPDVLANGTSTVALMPGSLASAWGYRREIRQCRRWAGLLAAPSLLGGVIGSLLVVVLPPGVFSQLVPWLILTAAVLFALQPVASRLLRRPAMAQAPGRGTLAAIIAAQLLIAAYGGYFGAGIGILMLSSLAFLGLGSIHQVNALKTFLALFINGVAAALFIAVGNVYWPFALAMAAWAIVGGYVGARLALRLRPAVVRWVVIGVGFGLAAYEFMRAWGGS
jgi:uncharacterized membrane protein YfcA